MPGKLSFVTQRLGDIIDDIQTVRPAYVGALDPSGSAAQAVAALGTRLVVRHYGPWDSVGDPAAVVSPENFVADCMNQEWWPYAWGVQTPNEPGQISAGWLARCVELFANAGKECVVGQWSTGHDGYAVPGARYYACHEYGWPALNSQQHYHALRYREWFPNVLASNPNAKLLITEVGVTQAVVGGPDVGYRTEGSAEDYWSTSLAWYSDQIDQDAYVESAFVFGDGMFGDWGTFEIHGTSIIQQMAGQAVPASTDFWGILVALVTIGGIGYTVYRAVKG